jgi:hypothetical protein
MLLNSISGFPTPAVMICEGLLFHTIELLIATLLLTSRTPPPLRPETLSAIVQLMNAARLSRQ